MPIRWWYIFFLSCALSDIDDERASHRAIRVRTHKTKNRDDGECYNQNAQTRWTMRLIKRDVRARRAQNAW